MSDSKSERATAIGTTVAAVGTIAAAIFAALAAWQASEAIDNSVNAGRPFLITEAGRLGNITAAQGDTVLGITPTIQNVGQRPLEELVIRCIMIGSDSLIDNWQNQTRLDDSNWTVVTTIAAGHSYETGIPISPRNGQHPAAAVIILGGTDTGTGRKIPAATYFLVRRATQWSSPTSDEASALSAWI